MPDNAERSLATVIGACMMLEGRTGRPIALMDGPVPTRRRTAATSALAAGYGDSILNLSVAQRDRYTALVASRRPGHATPGGTRMGLFALLLTPRRGDAAASSPFTMRQSSAGVNPRNESKKGDRAL